MLRKMTASVLAAGLSLMALTACGGNGGGDGTDGEGAANSEPTIEISVFAGSLPEASPTGEGVKAMVDAINEADAGIEATAFFDTSLGDASTMIQGLQQGTIDVGVAGNAYYSGLIPQVQVFELPFLFESVADARSVTAPGEVRDAVFANFEGSGIVPISLWEGGMRQLSNNVRPVVTPADLEGIKIRTLPAPIQQAAWSAMGALPQAIDAAELYTALQQGTVSAQENPLYEIVFRSFYEVQDYITLTSHVYTPFTMGMSEMTWNRLSEEQRQVVLDSAEVGRDAQLAANDAAEADAEQVLLDNGVEIEENPDREAFVELATTVWPQFTDEYGTELLDLIQSKTGE